ncbi:hypothetical protein MKW98_002008 [Papaver atlanticum]|uniref:Uncharacterized protein n=1 Tax=Papaver atlanticum TaxID=357466 RepID=A0AAD4SQA8_9MAGN|nr:hypothetical protein MKW98_002008 [Papaver atlanticum]
MVVREGYEMSCPFCTLLVYESRHHVLLIVAKQDVSKWMKSLVGRADSAWKINGFMNDDAAAEVDPIRSQFQWEMFKRLGQIAYNIWGGVDSVDVMEEFIQDFADKTSFMQYFKACWVPKIVGMHLLGCLDNVSKGIGGINFNNVEREKSHCWPVLLLFESDMNRQTSLLFSPIYTTDITQLGLLKWQVANRGIFLRFVRMSPFIGSMERSIACTKESHS